MVHCFVKAMVGVVKFSGAAKVGDMLTFRKGDHEFTEEVKSMQVDHKPVTSAKKGEEVAIKISEATKQGASVFKA